MATTIQDDDLDNSNQPSSSSSANSTTQNSPSGSTVGTSGTSGTVTPNAGQVSPTVTPGSSTPSNTVNTPAAQKTGSGYTNIQKIASANSGNRLASTVGNGVDAAGTSAKNAITGAYNSFNTDANASNPYLTNVAQTQQQINNVVADPTSQADANATNFANYRSGTYSGPQDLSAYGYDDVQNQADQAQALGQNLSTNGGRTALLQRFVANPTQAYNTGESNLDSTLLGLGPQQALQTAQKDTRNLSNTAASTNAQAQGQASDYAARAKALADYVNQQVQGAEQPTLDNLNATATADTAKVAKTFSDIQNNTASDDELRSVGLGDLIGKNTLGIDVGKYITRTNPNAATGLGVADSATQAKLLALAKLGGQSDLTSQYTGTAGDYLTNQFGGSADALGAYNKAAGDYSNLNTQNTNLDGSASNEISSYLNSTYNNPSATGQNGTLNASALGGLTRVLTPDLIDSYVKGNAQTQQSIREGLLGDDSLQKITGFNNPGPLRDAIGNILSKYAAQYQANIGALNQYSNGGATFGGAGPTSTVASGSDPNAGATT